MAIELERFSTLKLANQTPDSANLVSREQDLLADIFPDTLKRYRDYPHAAWSILKIAWNQHMEGFLARDTEEDSRAIGMATLIMQKSVIHPVFGHIRGNDIDYWLGQDATFQQHRDIAEALKNRSSREQLRRFGAPKTTGPGQGDIAVTDTVNNIMATTPVNRAYNQGLHDIMSPLGRPVKLYVPEDEKQFGLDKGGVPLQLYVGSYLVERPLGGPTTIERIPTYLHD